MSWLLAMASAVALVSTLIVITRRQAVSALLYLVVSLLAVSVVMLLLGAVFIAALEVIVYAGAIMVLFIFVVMMIGPHRDQPAPRAWIGPTILAAILLAELSWMIARPPRVDIPPAVIEPRDVGIALIGRYLLATEVAVFLLVAGLVGAFHLGRRGRQSGEGGRGW